MLLKPLTNRIESESAFTQFKEQFVRGAHTFPGHSIGFQGGGHNCDVFWHGALGIWGLFEPLVEERRYWICYGLQNPAEHPSLTITVETNPPIEGVDRRCAGAFLQNDLGDLYIAHSGKVGGGRKGIGKKAFRAYTRDQSWETVVWPDGKESRYRVISKLDTLELPSKMAKFVHEVAQFKEYAGGDYDAESARLNELSEKLLKAGAFEAASLKDAREKNLREVAVRRGQPKFRKELVVAYGGRCAITGCDFEEALEAAHIMPYLGAHTNDVRNGLLLRADIHTLFDRGYIAINSDDMSVLLSDKLSKITSYKPLSKRKLNLPKDKRLHPDIEALSKHRNWAFGES